MSPRTFLVTGATDGIGRQTALTLARRGGRVLVHGRTLPKAQAARDAIHAEAPAAELEALAADLSSMDEVRAMARDAAAVSPVIDVLIHNAGIFMKDRKLTADGFEVTVAVNHLAPFLLTHLLLPQVRASDEPRIVSVSSIAHSRASIDWDDLSMERGFSGYGAYAASKLMNVLFAFDLARRLTSPFAAVNALHPGVITTKLLAAGFGATGASLEKGAATSLSLATDPRHARTTGKYFSDEREATAARAAHDRAAQERLYAVSAQMTGVSPLPPG